MALPEPVEGLDPGNGPLLDRFARAHSYLRVSVTDRCNYRCTYCLPADGIQWMKRAEVLSLEEIARLVRVFATVGVKRVRLTGGEPTVRKDLERLVADIAAIPEIVDLSMTTNGHLFADRALRFKEAGLTRVNISLDSLDPSRFAAVTRGGDLGRVLAAIEAAREVGLGPVKVNTVVVRGINDQEVPDLVDWFAKWPDVVLRFIEYMPFDGNDARKQHVPVAEIREAIFSRHPVAPAGDVAGVGPAVNWRLEDTGQTVGFISPITEHFCQACNRLRLGVDGHLRTCLSRDDTPSLRDLLRRGLPDELLAVAIRGMVWGKVAGHEAHHLADYRAFEGVMTRIGG